MVRTKEEGTGVDDNIAKVVPIKPASSVKMRTKSDKELSLMVDKSSFSIGFIISACVFIMFIIGCIVGSTMI